MIGDHVVGANAEISGARNRPQTPGIAQIREERVLLSVRVPDGIVNVVNHATSLAAQCAHSAGAKELFLHQDDVVILDLIPLRKRIGRPRLELNSELAQGLNELKDAKLGTGLMLITEG